MANAISKRTKLLGLVGATGAGKTELALRLAERQGYVRVHMGEPIKAMLAALGLSDEELNGPPQVRSAPVALLSGRSPRYAMQTLGTDWGRRMISPHIWADALNRRLEVLIGQGVEAIVIDDLRFPEDFAVISQLEGVIVRVVRPDVSRNRSPLDHLAKSWPRSRPLLKLTGMRMAHETELHWHDAPAAFDVVNDGEIEDAMSRLLVELENYNGSISNRC